MRGTTYQLSLRNQIWCPVADMRSIFLYFPLVCFIFHTFTQFVAIQNVQNSQTAFYLIYVQINLYRQNSGPEELSQRKIL